MKIPKPLKQCALNHLLALQQMLPCLANPTTAHRNRCNLVYIITDHFIITLTHTHVLMAGSWRPTKYTIITYSTFHTSHQSQLTFNEVLTSDITSTLSCSHSHKLCTHFPKRFSPRNCYDKTPCIPHISFISILSISPMNYPHIKHCSHKHLNIWVLTLT